MTPQEQQMIDGLVKRIVSTPVTDKDLVADRYLQQSLASSPDALYVLAQTVLVQQYGLQQAQDQIRDLQAQNDQLQSQPQTQGSTGGSFLSHLFGGSGSGTQTAPPPPQQPSFQPVGNAGGRPAWSAFGGQSTTVPAYAQPMMYPAAPAPFAAPSPFAAPAPAYAAPSAGGGFLRGALQTAAGVAAGEVAFAGMESLFHGFGGGGFGGGYGGGFGGSAPREEVVNNYFGGSDRGDSARGEDGHGEDHHRESARDDSDMSYDSSAPDQGFDSSSDNSGSDDTSFTSDDTGGGDDGSSY